MKSIIVALLTISSTLGTAFAGPINLVANGDFESPALSGNGVIYSNNPSFSLPGWTVPTGANQFYLEYGQPFGGPRYNDGRQAVSLNCDGSPCSMSQTLNLIAGDTYTLTFALAEEHTTRRSVQPPSALTSAQAAKISVWATLMAIKFSPLIL